MSGGLPLPIALPGAPNCELLVSADVLELAVTDASGAASAPIAVPSNQTLLGLEIFHQWAIYDPSVNNLAIVMSNGGVAKIGN